MSSHPFVEPPYAGGPARTVGVGAAVSNGRGYPIFLLFSFVGGRRRTGQPRDTNECSAESAIEPTGKQKTTTAATANIIESVRVETSSVTQLAGTNPNIDKRINTEGIATPQIPPAMSGTRIW